MGYGQVGEILNTLNFTIASAYYNWGPFFNGDGTFPGDGPYPSGYYYPVNQGTDANCVWSFVPSETSLYWPISVTASSTHHNPDAGIENSGAVVSMANIEIYVRAQLFIVNTVTNTAGATLDIPITGLNTIEGATISVPYTTWNPLQGTGQQHKIVLRVYVAHFKYKKGCWSGGNHSLRSNETTYADVDMVPVSPGTYDWEKGWVDNVSSPVVATWSGTQYLSRTSNTYYYSSTISMNIILETILPLHPVYGAATNYITGPVFSSSDIFNVSVIWEDAPPAAPAFSGPPDGGGIQP